ncbi:MAG: hypothetical protein HQK60_09515 [Deltaproteobacteria bacterium]|nr:hypothetical protein [Deltaproteobacteria bacterium]
MKEDLMTNHARSLGASDTGWFIGLLLLFILWHFSLGTAALAGNAELMQKWEEQKQQIKNQVLKKLRRENKLPQNGTVKFTARVKPRPDRSGEYDIDIESLEIQPNQNPSGAASATTSKETGPGQNLNAVFAPQSLDPVYSYGEIRFDGGKADTWRITISESFTGGGQAITR